MSSPPVAVRAWPLVSSSRYRHPGDVIRLICGIVLLGCSLAASAAALRWLLGPAAPVVDSLGPARRVVPDDLVEEPGRGDEGQHAG